MDTSFHEEQPLVSVVMCVYNPGAFLQPALDSILNQTYKNWELIISDDGSNDGTREFLREFKNHPKVKVFFQEKNLGYVANKNFAHKQAAGVYITQLDNDDTCSYDRLEKQIAVVRENPEIRLVASGYNRIDELGNVYETVGPNEAGFIKGRKNDAYKFWFPSLLVHQQVFEKVGLFDTYFSGLFGDDIYWTVKANKENPIWCLKEPLYNYRNTPNSITKVLDNERKLIIPVVVEKLLQQIEANGTDWLTEGNTEAIRNYERELLNDNKFLSDLYRAWAAKSIDKNDLTQAGKLLRKAFKINKSSTETFKTFIYYIRKKYF